MALFGSDFNASRPADGDYAQHQSGETAASVIRELKRRVKWFFGYAFDTESGGFKPGMLPGSCLADRSPNPAGSHARVVVDPRGLVVSGREETTPPHARPFRAFFLPDGTGFSETPTGTSELVGSAEETPDDQIFIGAGVTTYFGFRLFAWEVPAGVPAVRAYLIGGGQAGRADMTGNAGAVCWVDFPVDASPAVSVIVGLGGEVADGSRVGGHSQIRQGDRFVNTATHTEAAGDWQHAGVGFPFRSSAETSISRNDPQVELQPMWYPYGKGGDVGAVGSDGLVILEWYA